MTKSRVAIAVVALLAVVGAAAYFLCGRRSAAYASALPADATALVRLDPVELLKEAEMSPFELVAYLSRVARTEDRPTGIDLKNPAYAFAAASGNFGLVAHLSDAADFAALCTSLHADGRASAISRSRGYSWVLLENEWLCAFDDERALVMGPAVGAAQDKLRTEMTRLLGQKQADSALPTSRFSRLQATGGIVAAVAAPELLPAEARALLRQAGIASAADAQLALSLRAEAADLVLDAAVVAESPEAQTQLAKLDSFLRPIGGVLDTFGTGSATASLQLNVSGSTLLAALRSNESVRTALLAMNLVIDLDRIIEAVDGDVAIEYQDIPGQRLLDSPASAFKGLSLYATLANDDFLAAADDWGTDLLRVQRIGGQSFAVDVYNTRIRFGVESGVFYLGDDKVLQPSRSSQLHEGGNEARGQRLYATFDMPALLRNVPGAAVLPDAVARCRRITLAMPAADRLQLRLSAQECTNIAKELLTNE